jgi:hypothetical protein
MSDSTKPAQSVSDAVLTQGARNLCPPSSRLIITNTLYLVRNLRLA